MKRRTKQFVTACLIVAAFTGTGAVPRTVPFTTVFCATSAAG